MANRWGQLAILCATRMSMGLHLQAVAAVAPFMAADLSLTYTELGLLIGVFMLPGVFLAIPGGAVSRRIGDKPTLLGAIGLLAAGTGLLAASPSFAVAVAARLLGGAGGTLLTMQVAKIATDWFAGRELATAVGLLIGTFPLGVALAMALFGGIAAGASWRLAVGLIAASALAILAAVALCLRDAPRAAPAAATPDSPSGGGGPRPSLARREAGLVLLAGVAFALVNAALVVFTSFTPTLLIARGSSEAAAGALASWTSWALMLAVVVAGVGLDRAGRTTAWLIGSAALTALACLALARTEPAWAWIALFGVLSAPVTVGAMALPGRVLRAEGRAAGFGLFFTTNYVGFALLPPVAGYLLDATGDPTAPILFAGALHLAIVPAVAVFARLGRPAAPAPGPEAAPAST
jgi:MFS family permease